MQSSPASCYFLPLRAKYSPWYSLLKHLYICKIEIFMVVKMETAIVGNLLQHYTASQLKRHLELSLYVLPLM
jgi:hypothetical protein